MYNVKLTSLSVIFYFSSVLSLSCIVFPALGEVPQQFQLSPKSEDLLLRAKLKFDSKDYEGTISQVSQAIQLDPTYAKAYALRGLARFCLKDDQGALSDLKMTAKLSLLHQDMTGYQLATHFIEAIEAEISYLNRPQTL